MTGGRDAVHPPSDMMGRIWFPLWRPGQARVAWRNGSTHTLESLGNVDGTAGTGGRRRAGFSGAAVRRFRYVADTLCLVAMSLYAINRWLVKPHVAAGFLHDHFNDLLLIPAGLPPVLWISAKLGWRPPAAWPTAGEVAGHLFVWSLICEWIGPRWLEMGTADWRDVAAYSIGALASWVWWRRCDVNRSRDGAAGTSR